VRMWRRGAALALPYQTRRSRDTRVCLASRYPPVCGGGPVAVSYHSGTDRMTIFRPADARSSYLCIVPVTPVERRDTVMGKEEDLWGLRVIEVVSIPVSDVDRAKAFYAETLGFTLNTD